MNSNPASLDQKNKATSKGSMLICDYMQQIEHTDRLPKDNLQPVLMGLFGEVGSIMATAKKYHREKQYMLVISRLWRKSSGMRFGILRHCVGVLALVLILFSPKRQVKTDTTRSSLQATSQIVQFLISRRLVQRLISTKPFWIWERLHRHCLASRDWINRHTIYYVRSQIAIYTHFKLPK